MKDKTTLMQFISNILSLRPLQNLRNTGTKYLLLFTCLFSLIQPAYADFINGGFEDIYTPSTANTWNPINGWTLTGYTFVSNPSATIPPTSISQINLTIPTTPGGITDIISGPTQTLFDWFLEGAT
ncbi:TPA: hypothetical protein JAN90_16465, partial [Legionella pneumophila]|nr:hypothetical protein [Legionella pneumophila]